MLKIGITGNTGSGKTTVAKIFEVLSVPVYNGDIEAKKFLRLPGIKKKLRAYFGDAVFDKTHEIDRKKLADIVFSDKQSLIKLNSLIHPLLFGSFEKWTRQYQKYPYVIMDAAIIFESGFYKVFDKIITVVAPEKICIKRIIERDGVLKEQVKNRIKNQIAEDKKAKLSDYIIKNDEITPLMPQVLSIHKKLCNKGL